MTDQISRPTRKGCPKPVLILILLALIAGPLLGLFPVYAAPAHTAPSAGFTVNSTADAGDANPGDGVCETAAGNGVCTLRAAIEETNTLGGADTINFDGSIAVVMPDDPLPALNDASGGTTIQGNPTWLMGSFAGVDARGLTLVSDGNKLQGLLITNFGAEGVRVVGNNNIIGTDGDGEDDASEGNVISGNGAYGVDIRNDATGTWLAGNLIGLTFDGTDDYGNVLSGVVIYFGAHTNRIGTNGDGISDELERNVISGNDGSGVVIAGSGVEQNTIAGNYIGTNMAGDAPITNTSSGVWIQNTANNLIGTDGDGTADELERNVISGNGGTGVRLDPNSSGNVVAGNYIGTNAAGDAAIPNGGSGGVLIQGASTNNLIGTDADGLSDELERNVISGNSTTGVRIYTEGTEGNVVAGNYIGTNAAGDAALPNGGRGVSVQTCANNRVGGTLAAERNVISGNGYDGVSLYYGITATLVQGNYIGTDASGSGNLGNGHHGVNLSTGAVGNTVGGTTSGAANRIAFNGKAGIRVAEYTPTNRLSYDNSLRGNAIFSNGDLGIDLWPEDITPNDVGDGDDGANHLQNFPVLSSAASDGSQIVIEGSLNSTGNTTFALDFYANSSCDASGYGEGEFYLGAYTVTTDGSGDVTFSTTLSASIPAGYAATATATDPDGNTSEFSACRPVTALCVPVHDADFAWDPITPIIDQIVTFTGTASGTTPIDFTWDLGDDNTAAGAVVQHSYSVAGDYTVIMTATNCTGTAVVTQTHIVTVLFQCEPVHDADFSWVPPTPIVDQVVTFTGSASGTAPIAFTWDLGDGSTAAGAVVQHSYSAAGDYTVIMTATNCTGTAVVTQTYVVTVLCDSVHDADFGWAPLLPMTDQVVTFTGTASGTAPIAFTWSFGDGDTGSGPVVQHSYSATGNYTVIMTATNCTGTAIATQTHVVTVLDVPCDPAYDADFGWAPAAPIVDQGITFTGSASGTAPIAFTWDLGDGNTAAGAVVQHSYSAAGSYTVTMTATNCGGLAVVTQMHIVTVQEPPCEPVQDAAFGWMPTTPAIGEMVTFNGSANGSSPITYTWAFGDSATGSGATITHTYAATGTYIVLMTATNACGHEGISHTLTVVQDPVCTPVQIVAVTPSITDCVVSFAAELYGDVPFDYVWDLGDGLTSTLAAPNHTYTATGTYTVTLQVWNCAEQGHDTYTLPVTVACPLPGYKVFLPLVCKNHGG